MADDLWIKWSLLFLDRNHFWMRSDCGDYWSTKEQMKNLELLIGTSGKRNRILDSWIKLRQDTFVCLFVFVCSYLSIQVCVHIYIYIYIISLYQTITFSSHVSISPSLFISINWFHCVHVHHSITLCFHLTVWLILVWSNS